MPTTTRFRGVPEEELTPNGTFKVEYARDIADELGRTCFVVGPNAAMAIREGYGCGNCLQYRIFGGTWLSRCPGCNAETGAGGPLQLCDVWF